MKDPILHLSILLALGGVFTTFPLLFKNDNHGEDGDESVILSFPTFDFIKAV